MKQCKHISALLSDYCDSELKDSVRLDVETHLTDCSFCSNEVVAIKRSLRVLRNMPLAEPSIDLWPEFATQLDTIESEMRLSAIQRLELAWQHALSRFAEGVVVYTHILAHNTFKRMEKYLVSNPFETAE